jgi:hypothetical protein
MELYWCRFKGGYRLFLPLGEKNGKLGCLDNAMLQESDIKKIKSVSNQLDKLDHDGKVKWIKNNTDAIKAYKTIKLSNVDVVKTYKIK